MSAENSEKPLGGWGSQHFPDLDGGEGLLPLPQETQPHSRPSAIQSCPQ